MASETREFQVGDLVKLLSVGDWLLNDLSESEQRGILGCVGKLMTISEIDQWGGIWVGIGRMTEDVDGTTYYGQSFLVEPQRIELVQPNRRALRMTC